MPKDLRDIVKEAQHEKLQLPKEHRDRFENRLGELQDSKKNNFFFLKIAASLLILISVGYFALKSDVNPSVTDPNVAPTKIVSLGSISPEMQKIENYYQSAISFELAELEPTPENKKLVDDYLETIGKLDADYKRLNKELSEKGLQEKTVNALITNLQLRLQLLLQLKDQINELKTSKENNNEEITI